MRPRSFLTIVTATLWCFSVDADSKCKTIHKGPEGSVRSPNYPKKYPKKTECEYVIKAEANHYIEVTFSDFHLEERDSRDNSLTDYLQVFDGREENRVREVTYTGQPMTPFKFVSKTNRVILEFVSDGGGNYPGFKATYEVFRRQCKPENFTVANADTECILEESGVDVESCNITCHDHYLLQGDGTVTCSNMDSLPVCRPDPEKLDICYEDITDKNCPFTKEETEASMAAFLEEIEIAAMTFGRGVSPSGGGCNLKLCWFNKIKKEFVIKCETRAQNLQKWYKWTGAKKNNWKLGCLSCQASFCGKPSSYFTG